MRSRRTDSHTSTRTGAAFEDGEADFYGGAVVGARTIGARATDPELVDRVVREIGERDPDSYVGYVTRFAASGRERAGAAWRYADITTALAAATELLHPTAYLEIGVRRGRSLCVVAARASRCSLTGVDLWNAGYAGIDNPGPEHVRRQVLGTGHLGSLELLSGSSHDVLPELFRDRPDADFDLITVDGDHSRRGAAKDLRAVLPRLRVGGALVFDDISHPSHPYLNDVWNAVVARERRYATWSFDDVGFGVAIAVRRW